MTEEVRKEIRVLPARQYPGKSLYIQDGYAVAGENTRPEIRLVSGLAWQAHFIKNMFIRPGKKELYDFKKVFVVLRSSDPILSFKFFLQPV